MLMIVYRLLIPDIYIYTHTHACMYIYVKKIQFYPVVDYENGGMI